ncbi:hypothetical protein M8J77_003116 [Diaphorina citri]|nr:hypothetical protein M8J77_003116 [Diaphorina citri]
MLKTIWLSILAFCLVDHAQCFWGWGPCPKVNEGQTVPAEDFSNEDWFEYKRSNEPKWETGTECNYLYLSKIPGTSYMQFVRSEEKENTQTIPIDVRWQPGGSREGRMIWEYKLGSSSYKQNVQVVSTISSRFIILWGCSNYYIFHTEWAQIWGDFLGANQSFVDSVTRDALKKLNPGLEFTWVNQRNCHYF